MIDQLNSIIDSNVAPAVVLYITLEIIPSILCLLVFSLLSALLITNYIRRIGLASAIFASAVFCSVPIAAYVIHDSRLPISESLQKKIIKRADISDISLLVIDRTLRELGIDQSSQMTRYEYGKLDASSIENSEKRLKSLLQDQGQGVKLFSDTDRERLRQDVRLRVTGQIQPVNRPNSKNDFASSVHSLVTQTVARPDIESGKSAEDASNPPFPFNFLILFSVLIPGMGMLYLFRSRYRRSSDDSREFESATEGLDDPGTPSIAGSTDLRESVNSGIKDPEVRVKRRRRVALLDRNPMTSEES